MVSLPPHISDYLLIRSNFLSLLKNALYRIAGLHLTNTDHQRIKAYDVAELLKKALTKVYIMERTVSRCGTTCIYPLEPNKFNKAAFATANQLNII